MKLKLKIIDGIYSIYKLNSLENLELPIKAGFYSLSITEDEYTLITSNDINQAARSVSKNWICIRVDGELDFDVVGIVSELTNVLSKCEIPVFAICTHDRDYVLVETKYSRKAVSALELRGHEFIT